MITAGPGGYQQPGYAPGAGMPQQMPGGMPQQMQPPQMNQMGGGNNGAGGFNFGM